MELTHYHRQTGRKTSYICVDVSKFVWLWRQVNGYTYTEAIWV